MLILHCAAQVWVLSNILRNDALNLVLPRLALLRATVINFSILPSAFRPFFIRLLWFLATEPWGLIVLDQVFINDISDVSSLQKVFVPSLINVEHINIVSSVVH